MSTTEEVYKDVNKSFCIIRSSFFMSIYMYIAMFLFFQVTLSLYILFTSENSGMSSGEKILFPWLYNKVVGQHIHQSPLCLVLALHKNQSENNFFNVALILTLDDFSDVLWIKYINNGYINHMEEKSLPPSNTFTKNIALGENLVWFANSVHICIISLNDIWLFTVIFSHFWFTFTFHLDSQQ